MAEILFGNVSDTPHYEAHRNFITGSDGSACGYVFQVPSEQRCVFVRETNDCHDMVNVVDYMTILFCYMSGFGTIVGIAAMIILSVYLVLLLVVNAQMNFAPNLLVISKSLHLSEYLAGITILPLGNGLVDLITGFEKYDGDTEMWSNEAMGTAMFVTAFIGGLIIVMHPFTVVPAFFIMQNVFYLATLTWITAIMINETVFLWEAIGCVLLYGFFVCSVIFFQIYRNSNRTVFYADINSVAYQQHTEPIKLKKRVSFNRDAQGISANHQIYQEYFNFLDHANFRVWFVSNNCQSVFFVFSYVPRLLMAVSVPSVNYALPMNNWCKLAIMVNMFFVPPIFLLAARVTAWQFFVGGLALSIVAAVIVFLTTKTYQRPRYHDAFALIGFATSIAIVYFAASELMSCLSSLFTLLNVERQTIGLAAVAWGNGLADLVVNLQVALSGHHVMAITACYSGPILNLLIGYGITFIMRASKSDDNKSKARSGTMGLSSVIYLFCFIIITMLWTMLSGFQSRRSIGLCMISIYFVYLIFCLLCELSLTHGYGTDHFNESPFQV